MKVHPITTMPPGRFDTVVMLKKVLRTRNIVGELKAQAKTIPNQGILINTLALQEARGSSVIENIMTTFRELVQSSEEALVDPAQKEVFSYRRGLLKGLDMMQENQILTQRAMVAIANEINDNQAGIRKVPGTVLRDSQGRTVFEPPQDHDEIVALLGDLERFLNDPEHAPEMDPLIKMALAHWSFECIHPFYDGNGRTGRILNVLFLVKEGLLEAPLLYLSRHIVKTKERYYTNIRAASEADDLEGWVSYMLEVVEESAKYTIQTIKDIGAALDRYERELREAHAFYKRELLDSIFLNPATSVEQIVKVLGVTRKTAAKYLDAMVETGHLDKEKVGRRNVFTNSALMAILQADEDSS